MSDELRERMRGLIENDGAPSDQPNIIVSADELRALLDERDRYREALRDIAAHDPDSRYAVPGWAQDRARSALGIVSADHQEETPQ